MRMEKAKQRKASTALKRILCTVLCFGLLLAASNTGTVTVSADTVQYTDGDFVYSIDLGSITAALVDYTGSATEVVIPDYFSYPILALSFNSIDIYVTSIDSMCFWDCAALTRVHLPKGLTIANLNTPMFNSSNTDLANLTICAGSADCDAARYAFAHGLIFEVCGAAPVMHTVTYNYAYNGGSSASSTTKSVQEYHFIDFTPTASRSGYTFVGWNTNATATAPMTSLRMETADVTLYAIYKKSFSVYFVEYNGDVKQTVSIEAELYNKQTKTAVYPPTPHVLTDAFASGWCDTTSPNNGILSEPFQMSASFTFYAQYSLFPLLSYDLNGGVGSVSGAYNTVHVNAYDITVKSSASIRVTRTVPTREGYTFLGWAFDSGAQVPDYLGGESFSPLEDTTLYAVWEEDLPTTYTIHFDPQGGSNAPVDQIKRLDVNIQISEQAPTRAGYNFMGWAVSAAAAAQGTVAYAPGAWYDGNADLSLYAVWIANRWLADSETFAFSNSHGNFLKSGETGYLIRDAEWSRLVNFVRVQYSNPDNIINSMAALRDSAWQGSCYGMAAAAVLDKTGQINFRRNFAANAATLYNAAKPIDSEAVRSAINYYMLSQRSQLVGLRSYTKNARTWTAGLQELVNAVKSGQLVFFCYGYADENKTLGHAIVLKGYEPGANGSHRLIAYDNNYPLQDIPVTVDAGYGSCTVNGSTDCLSVSFLRQNELNAFDAIDIDGPNNDMVFPSVTNTLKQSDTQIAILAKGTTTVTNQAGQTLTYNASTGAISGTMTVNSQSFVVNSTAGSNPAPATMVFHVPNSNAFTVTCNTPGIDVSVTNSNLFAAAASGEARDATINQSTGVTVSGDNSFDYKTSLSLNNSMGEMITAEGTGNASASIVRSGAGIEVTDGMGGASLSVYGSDYVPESYQIPAGVTTAVLSGSASDLSIVCPHQYGAKHRNGTHWERTCTLCSQVENSAFTFWDWILFIICFGWIWM